MNPALKYVVISADAGEQVLFALAPVTHFALAEAWCSRHGGAPISAGYAVFDSQGCVTTCSESVTLGLRPRVQDAKIIQMLARATGYDVAEELRRIAPLKNQPSSLNQG